MIHLLVIVLLIVFVPIALATLQPVLTPILRTAIMLIFAPFFAVWLIVHGLYCAPGAIYRGIRRLPGWIRRDLRKTAEFSCLKNMGGSVVICLAVTFLLLPFFPH